jgi:Protein of unknown function (DUF998)
MSAYYHAIADGKSMRDWFVGILFAVAIFLYLYKGYSAAENIALNLAGAFAVGIAIFPMEWNCGDACKDFSVHGFCAISFFLCIAFVCIRCASDTLKRIPDEKTKRRYGRLYKIIGLVMIAAPAIAFALTVLLRQYSSRTFIAEAVGIFAFATYWLAKSRELYVTQVERKALHSELNI